MLILGCLRLALSILLTISPLMGYRHAFACPFDNRDFKDSWARFEDMENGTTEK